MAENHKAPANLNDGSNMRTGTIGASCDSSHLLCFTVLYFKIISTSLPSAHQHICISYCKTLAASGRLLILLWNITVWIKCVFSPCWALAHHAVSGRLTLISPSNTDIDSYAEWSIPVIAKIKTEWRYTEYSVLYWAIGVQVVNRWACPH